MRIRIGVQIREGRREEMAGAWSGTLGACGNWAGCDLGMTGCLPLGASSLASAFHLLPPILHKGLPAHGVARLAARVSQSRSKVQHL